MSEMPLMADVVEINDLDQLPHIRMTWNALLGETPRASFFHTFDWFQLFWRHFGRGREFRVLVVRSEGVPIGIVPLCIQEERYQVGRLRVLTYPLSDWGMWYSPIGPNQAGTMHLAMQHLAATPREWDLLDLRWTDCQCRGGAIENAMRFAGFTPQRRPYQQTSVVRIDSPWDAYLGTLDKKWRHEVRRRLRLADRIHADVEFVRHRPAPAVEGDGDPRWDLWEVCQKIASASWQSQSTTGNTICHEKFREFLRDCHAAAARLGMLDVTLLKIDNQPAAFGYNYHRDGAVVGLRMGYDRGFADLGVGGTLLAATLRDSFNRGDRSFDLGIGEFKFKRRYRNVLDQSYQFSHYPATAWKSQGVRLTRWLKDAAAL